MTRKIIGKSLDLTSVKAVIQETVINDSNENNDEEQENGYYPLMIHIGNSSNNLELCDTTSLIKHLNGHK